ncbi:MAG: ComEC/Rec2 family competence protein [Dysgonomonas sp.]
MSEKLATYPFFRLLLPLVAGILLVYYISVPYWLLYLLLISGVIAFSIPYFLSPRSKYRFRWFFGLGVYILLFSIGSIFTDFRKTQSSYDFADEQLSYKGTIVNIPQQKEKSIACEVELDNLGKKVVCYFQKGVRSKKLRIGDEIMFFGKIHKFKYFGDPDEFDYPRYMYNKGFSGSIYLFSDDWEASGKKTSSLSIVALQIRQKILDFYKSLNIDETQYSILSALTLGYQTDLSDDLKQSFRATGTAHVLAVSGMHVGIIYGVLLSFFGLFYKKVRNVRYVQLIVIVFLWLYAFLTGLSPSVVRASLMLSVFCISNILHRRGLTYNNICIAAFFMLLYNPFNLFDLGFQLSFIAVLSICFCQPVFSNLVNIDNKYLRQIWQLFTLSIAAQLGTFPVCLYYFGTFPTYFFITNLLVVPLVSLIVYLAIALSVFHLLSLPFPAVIANTVDSVFLSILKFVITVMVDIIHFFENLPYAVISNIKISMASVVLLFVVIFSFSLFFFYKKRKMLLVGLTSVSLLLASYAVNNILFTENKLTLYQQDNYTAVKWNVGHESYKLDSIDNSRFIKLNGINFLSVTEDYRNYRNPNTPLNIDYLHIVKNDTISLYSLTRIFYIQNVVLDYSLSGRSVKRITKECEKLNIPCYDMSEKGIFRIIF